jgi:hypothetical protein
MFTRNHTILQGDQGRVKVDPTLSRSRISCVLIYVGAAMLVTSSILLFLLHESNPFPSIIYFIIFATNIPGSISVIKRVGYKERLEQRRQAAARGDQSLLAAVQPLQDATALPMPITLGRHHKGKIYILILTVNLLLLLILSIPLYIVLPHLFPLLPGGSLSQQAFAMIILGSFVFLVLLVFGLLLGILYAKEREQLTVTEYGLIKIGLWGKVQSMSWQEARLFAIDGMYGLKKIDRIIPTRYELSSAHDILHWGPLLDTAVVSGGVGNPLQARANYLQALHSLIAAKTELPLYDLRES